MAVQTNPGKEVVIKVRDLVVGFRDTIVAAGLKPEVIIGEVGPNEYVGESALFTQALEHATLRIVL